MLLPLRKYHVPTNWQPCRCSVTFLRCFVFAIRIGSYVYVYSCIFKNERGNKRIREKSDIKFLFWKDRLVPRLARSYEEPPCFYIRSSCSIAESGGFLDFIILNTNILIFLRSSIKKTEMFIGSTRLQIEETRVQIR